MNYAGKFDAGLTLDGQGSRSSADSHVESFTATAHGHVPDGAVVIADPNLIFHGEFKRTGSDLVLSHDGHDFVVHDYFRGDKRAAIASPDGAHLTGDIVSALTGYVQVAQAAPGAAAAQVIGHVTKLTGSATVVRNGVSVILNNGDNVEKGDVVSTGSDSTLGITFIDGTVFGLSANARMVLNEMVYDPNGSNNSSLLSLVAGTITFVAGETAKHGDMKVDTPVATMGIRGTAVLTEIAFVVPSGGGDPQPQANFQVLVEPNGTTGSYILFDKQTLLPIATVNQAGQMIQISGGNVSVSNALLSPDVQKLINDVFTLKFTDNNTNTKLTNNSTDSITQTGDIVLIKTPDGSTAQAIFTNTVAGGAGSPAPGGSDKGGVDRIPGAPFASVLDTNGNVVTAFALTEHAKATGDHGDATGDAVPPDVIIFRVNFVDQNLGDRPTVSVDLDASKYTYTDSGHHDVTPSLTALQKQDIAATQVKINVVADGGNNNNGTAVATYTIPDHAFDFLADGETLTLTYVVHVNNNFAVNPETKDIPITITITGTNDRPVITTSVPTITFSGGTSVPGGPLTTNVPTAGTLTFKDVDLTDTHTVSVALTSASLPDGTTVPPGPLAAFQKAMSVAIGNGLDSTGTGTGTINWSLADLPVYLADFIPKGEVLTLVYTVTVADEHDATSQQTITVTLTGTDAPAVVWIGTNQPSGGFWKDAANWETGTVPTSNDDVIIITDQLHGLTPSYPVTIDAAAYGKSLTMDDYDTTVHHTAPEVINHSTLTLGGKLTLNADAKFTNAADGTVLVGGAIDVETITRTNGDVVASTAKITNAGQLTLAAGGKIDTLTTITNSGTIELSGGTLTLDTGIANAGGTVQVDSVATLVADAVTIDGGTLAILGTLELDGTSLIENGTLNNSGAVHVKGAVEFANETVGNLSLGTIEVFADAVLTIDKGSIVNNAGKVSVDAHAQMFLNDATISGGVVSIEAGSTLDLSTATIDGGTLTLAGTLESTGASAISNADITNTGTISVTSGTLTIDPVVIHTLTNSKLLQANGGELDVIGEAIVNTADIKAINSGILKLSSLNVTNNSGAVTVDGTSKLYLTVASINGGSLNNSGHLYGVSGFNTISAGITNTGTIEVQAGTLNLSGGLAGAGSLVIDDGATLELAGATAQTVTFAGGADTLQLDKVVGQSLTGTITGQSSTGGTFTVTGAADITTSSGDALDFTASGGSSLKPANIVLTPAGTLTGHDSGIVVTQDGAGSISLTTVGDITGQTGSGILLHDGVSGAGDITATIGGGVSGAVGLDVVSHGDGAVNITNNGHITGTASFGIHVDQDDSDAAGSTSITNAGTVVGADGVAAISIQENTTGFATIDNSGTIGPDAAGSVASTTYAIAEAGGPVTINNTGDINGNISVASATFDNKAAGTWTVSGTSVFGTLSKIDNAGEIDLHDGASVSSADGASFGITNSGKIESWGTASITGSITNTNTIEVHTDGTLSLFGSLSGSGSVTIDANATLDVDAAVSQTITFNGGGAELQIDTSSFGGSVAGFASTDKLDLSTIEFDGGTSATYDSATGDLVVSDAYGHSITVKLTGGDYSNAHFAGSSDGHGGTLITLNAADDAPAFNAAETSPSVSFAELDNKTGDATMDPASGGTGTIDFTDIDLTERPTAKITHQDVTWLAADHTTALTLTPDEISALEHALTLQQTGNRNNGTVGWSYSIADSALDFLGQGQTATVVSTITLDDGHKSDTAQVTVTISGANDAPTLADLDIGSLADTGVSDSFADLTGKLAGTDADTGETATLSYALLDAEHNATTTVAGQYGSLTVDSNGNYDYVPDSAAINALQAGAYVDTFTVQTTDAHGAHGTATLTVNVNGANDAPTLDGTKLDSVAADNTNPTGSAVSDLFAGKFHDVDTGASFKAIAVSADNATSDQGSWQYEIAGTDQWVDISGVSNTNALVLSTDTLIRFVPNGSFSGTPGTLDVHAIDNTYTGAVSANSPVSIDISGAGHGGTTPVSDQAASIGTEVTAPAEVEMAVAPVLSLGPNTSIYPTDGSALVTQLSLHAGDIVSVDWNFTTDDYLPYNDFAFASVNGAAFLLSDIEATGSYGSTGWHTFTYKIQTDGTYAFGAGVMNEKDYAVTSFLAVDNIRVNGEVVQSFENGFGDTQVTGQVAIVSTAHSDVGGSQIVPTDGNFEAFLSSYPTYKASIEDFLGLGSGELSNIAKSEGPEHTPINVPITVTIPTGAHPDDTYVTIAGAPVGSEFNYGTYDASNNTWHIEATDLGGNLTLTTPVGYAGSFNITVTATSVVDSSHTSATTLPQTHAVTIDPLAGPEIDTTHFTVSENPDGTTSVLGLAITDEDPAAPSEAFALSATTQAEGSSVSPGTGAGNLNDINALLASGVTYAPGADKPATDMVTFKVTDNFGASDTVNFVFNDGGPGPVSLVGTSGKDVLFASGQSDTLDGKGGQDQFVFAPKSFSDTVQHTVYEFDTTLDKIDVRQFDNINSFSDITLTQQNADTLVRLDDHETILLKNVVVNNLHASDFIVTNHSVGGSV
ncbi:VCBS domain-containing protein [Bradyrhizobium sp. DASA03076]